MNFMAKYIFQIIAKILLAIILISFFSTCNELREKDISRTQTVEEFILEMIIDDKNLDNIVPIITNLVINDTLGFIYIISNYIDYGKNVESLKIDKKKIIPEYYYYEGFGCFSICILGKDSVYVDGMHSDLSPFLIRQLKNFYSIKNNDIMDYSNGVDDNDIVINIYVNSKNIRPNNEYSVWNYFFYSLKSIFYFYDKLCNEASFKKYGVNFIKLSPMEKKTIIESMPLRINIDFDVYCY